jgi:transcriptional regulator with XRE-family HTH domain
MPAKGPHPVDVHVGGRLKLRRKLMGITQGKLGDAVGLTFQQIQKYERGANRMGSSRLHQFSEILDVPISFFFDDMPGDVETRVVKGYMPSVEPDDVMSRDETLELVRMYYSAKTPAVRKRMLELVKALARSTGDETGRNN